MNSKVSPLVEAEISKRLERHFAWKRVAPDRIRRELKFKDFSQAFAAMTRIAIAAEKLDHHPEWSNVYNRVVVELTTHDAGPALSEKDFTLATEIDRIVLECLPTT